ncbi:MAG: phosphoribosyl-AMP cyclohydrolase [Rhodospirillales bacterium]|nr:phosphoribosyl-AMP cyclohydrolase [Rhodospirillales bacterium]
MSETDTAAPILAELRFDAAGLIPAIAQQHDTGEVLMLAWMNAAALRETIATGRVCYFSRSRGTLWRKGESSGQTQRLVELRIDCDGDAVLLLVDQHGVACHTGRRSCFFRALRDGTLVEIMAPEVAEAVLYGAAKLAELREAEADPATAAIYAEIRTMSGVPLVNLIWRHFATLPGVLPWAWGAVAALVGSAAMDRARAAVAGAIVLPSLARPDAAALARAGLTGPAHAAAKSVVDAYARGNLTNLVALTALRLGRTSVPDGDGAATRAALAPVPKLPRLDALAPEIAARVRSLAARHPSAGTGVIPSLYLHLAHWPGLLAALEDWLGALLQPAALEAARVSAVAAAERAVAGLAPLATAPPEGQDTAVTAALRRFTTGVIPDLVPVCLALQGMLAA